jgi:hypothetical protein
MAVLSGRSSFTCEIQYTIFPRPARWVPDPVYQRAVYDGHPEEGEDHCGQKAPSINNGADPDTDSDARDFDLEEAEQQVRDEGSSAGW